MVNGRAPEPPFLWHGTCQVARPFFASEDVTFIRMTKGAALAWITALISLLHASSPVASSAAAREPTPDATIQELMTTRIDPAADALWASVSTVITAAGVQEKQPRTEAEWQTVRRHAVTLIEGAKLLATPARRVAMPGRGDRRLSDSGNRKAGEYSAGDPRQADAATGRSRLGLRWRGRPQDLDPAAPPILRSRSGRRTARRTTSATVPRRR